MLQPSKEQIINKLENILREELTREEVIDWALHFIENDELKIVDHIAWEYLKIVGGLDMIESPGVYLYSLDDIIEWISDLSR